MQGCASTPACRVGRWLVTAALAGLAAPTTASADVYTVTSQADSSQKCADLGCPSIRGALAEARAGDTIAIPAGTYRLTLGQLSVPRSVTVTGAGADRTTIEGSGGQGGRIFEVGDPSTDPTVEISHLTMAGGTSFCGAGGNLVNHGDLRLHHVHVTGGRAASGGGVANLSGVLSIEQSLVDGNTAVGCDGGGAGGGILSEAAAEDALVVRDSTVASNAAAYGGGIAVYDYSELQRPLGTRLERVTVAHNAASADPSGGVYAGFGTRVHAGGAIIAANTAETTGPGNCGATRPEDGGGNLSDTGDCFAGAPADPRLSADLVAGLGETAVLVLDPGSPAVDLAGACEGADQRDLARPQGGACDAGAYEVAVPVIEAGPAGPTSDRAPTFTFSSPEPGATFECRLDGPAGAGPWEPCASPKGYAALGDGTYAFHVRSAGASAHTERTFTVATAPPPAALQPPPPPPPAPTPSAAPRPEYRKSVVVKPTQGTVRVRLRGTKRYVGLDGLDGLPLGSSIDVRKGRVRLYAAPGRDGEVQAASFFGGVFRVVQRGTLIELQLRGPAPRCASGAASAAAAKRAKKARKRRLWGSGRGRFRTRGAYSAATVRGTKWLVEDSCRSTTTRVTRGVVKIRDFKRRKTITLRAGGRYVASRR